MTTKFSKFATDITSSPNRCLPLTHTMDWKQFIKIMDGPAILEAPTCDVFTPDKLAYMFYGRPCYKMHMGQDANSIPSMDSVCLLLDAETLPNPKRLYPFDSGAFHEGLYKCYCHPDDEKEQFEIEPSLENAKRTVGRFFGTNLNYYKGKALSSIAPPPTELDAITYLSLVKATSKSQIDSRKSAIEFQYDGDIDLLAVRVLAVIANEDVFDEPDTRDFVENTLHAVPIGYFSPHSKTEEEALVIMNLVKDFCMKRGDFQ